MKTSKLFSLSKLDWLKTFIMTMISTVTAVLLDAVVQQVQAGTYCLACIHWKEIAFSVAVVVLSYIQKQFGSNSEGKFLKKE